MVERHLFNLDANGSSVKMELDVLMFACVASYDSDGLTLT